MIEYLWHSHESIAQEIAALQQEAYRKEAELIDFFGIPALKEKAIDIIKSQERFAGYKERERLLGVISYEKNAGELTICRLAVHPDGFRKGIGQALTKFVIAENEDAEKIEVTTAENNTPAISLYTKAGFTKAARIKAAEGIFLSVFHLYPKRKVEVVPYREEWKRMFAKEKIQLERILGPEIITISHIGSTSIPGMSAKPVIDILIEVKDIEAINQYNLQMEALGYEAKGENGLKGRCFFRKGGNKRTHHVHIYENGNREIVRHTLFRDYLIAHPEKAAEYATLKKQLAARYPDDIKQYIEGKNEWIKDTEEKANRWKN
ncbi:GNAT family N-acetyltransferase [Bacillus atrophaeus]|uniref:GNAT family N-acetyltransferase n=1 Tax=Bacillus atrophaeus TaxID=1452 RepID=UPI00227F7868|nr:GNAT family N-acetyltransferase [Bacillus atrophaeus]MCY8496316.1 GNAT family N-acetyltransferase [Bacillus atrophaeus]MCY8811212.1 GNAT family N-acetyltransferase [Bacillus atrophaeus]MCY8822578.1 GNAT family N-acetyltransferase [Bacillus atrophaeus]MCY8829014.1 GNAT family N-acetyltransferase [Bacillus atrophaeus]MCY8834220.1 GNAT family N-acetyltransferase [Bacillus atrophaeus]